jgi:DNA repair exonuclease SbcCD nuclease subunit
MSKILLFGDLHVHPHKRSSERLQDCLDCLEWIFQTARDREIKSIIFLGDLFHDRQKIDVLTYQKTFEIFESHSKNFEEIYLLLGNHDLWHLNKWDVSSVNPLRAIPRVRVIDKPTTRPVLGCYPVSFMPYTHDPLSTLKEIENDREEHIAKCSRPLMDAPYKAGHKYPRILCGHVAVDGAVWNTKHQTFSEVVVEHDGDMVKVDSDTFKGWDRVFLGHYHAAQQLDAAVEYVGSPLQLSFGETQQTKHILIYDLHDNKKEYIENDFSPKHLILSESQLSKHNLKGQFVRIAVDDISASNVVEMQRTLAEQGVKEIHISQAPKKEEHIITDAKAIFAKEDEMLERYLDDLDLGDLDKNKLLKIGKAICEEGHEKS